MTTDEIRLLLPLYADGLLDVKEAQKVEQALAETPELQAELNKLREENALISEALAPLNPSRSSRMKLSEAMQHVHQSAERVANTIPRRDWRIFRVCFAVCVIIGFVYIWKAYPLPSQELNGEETTRLTYPLVLGPFILGVVFLLGAEVLARGETWLAAKLLDKHIERSRLEVFMLETFGITGIIFSAIIYLFLLRV
jgi:hypothetical protein